MITIIWCFLPFLFIFWNMKLLKKRKSVSFEIKKGQICFNCKTDLGLSDSDKFKRIMDANDFYRLCVCCNRDRKINSLSSRLLKYKYILQKFLASKKSDKLIWWFLVPVFFFILLDILFKIIGFGVYGIPWIYGSINIIYWCLITYKNYYTSIKKPSDV